MLQELFSENGIGRQFTHHDNAQAVVTTTQTVFSKQLNDIGRLRYGAHKRNHDLNIVETHILTHALESFALHIKTLAEAV